MGTANSKLKIAAGLIGGGFFLYFLQYDSSEGGVSGISNMGNTCFLNAILQALSSCDSFTTFLFKLKPVQKSFDDHDACIVMELSRFLQSLTQGKETSPEDLINSLSYKFPFFGQQHDSHEIFYVIHESIESIKKRTENSISFDLPLENPLLSLMSTEIVCSVCTNKSIKLDCLFDVSLDVTSSLRESFQGLHQPEIVEDYLCIKCSTDASMKILKARQSTQLGKEILNKYIVNRGKVEESELLRKVKNRVVISNKIIKFPKLLCIHCKWLVPHVSGLVFKKNNHMQFPMKFQVEKGGYELKAVIEHLGGSTGGHYLTYKEVLGAWYQCSDLSVREVTQRDVLVAQPYMLFYQLAV